MSGSRCRVEGFYTCKVFIFAPWTRELVFGVPWSMVPRGPDMQGQLGNTLSRMAPSFRAQRCIFSWEGSRSPVIRVEAGQ